MTVGEVIPLPETSKVDVLTPKKKSTGEVDSLIQELGNLIALPVEELNPVPLSTDALPSTVSQPIIGPQGETMETSASQVGTSEDQAEDWSLITRSRKSPLEGILKLPWNLQQQ